MTSNDIAQPPGLAELEVALRDALLRHPPADEWGRILAAAITNHPDPAAVVQVLRQTLAAYSTPATALLSEPALEDWNRPEEDAAWSYLQPKK